MFAAILLLASPTAPADLDRFAHAIEAQRRLGLAAKLAAYECRLKARWWDQGGRRQEWQAEVDLAHEAAESWRLLAEAAIYVGHAGEDPRDCWARCGRLHQLRRWIGEEAYARGEMPAIPEGVWITEERLDWPAYQAAEWLPMPRRRP